MYSVEVISILENYSFLECGNVEDASIVVGDGKIKLRKLHFFNYKLIN